MKDLYHMLTGLVLACLFALPAFAQEDTPPAPNGTPPYRDVPVELSLFSPAEIFHHPRKRVNGFQLNILYGRTYALRGFATGIVHVAEKEMTGFQLNAANMAPGKVRGLQLGFINRGAGVRGMQGALINIATPDTRGLQLGIINMATSFLESEKTFLETGTYRGAQLGIFNLGDSITGTQCGIINVADTVTGLQLGIINIADSVESAAVGLINIYRNGFWDISTYFSMNTLLNIAIRSRGTWSYGIFMVGYDPRSDTDLDRASIGFGFGFHFSWGSFYLDTDFTYHLTAKGFNSNLFEHDSGTNRGYGTIKIRILPGWQIMKRLSLFAGPVCNIYPPISRDFGYRFDFNAGVNVTVF